MQRDYERDYSFHFSEADEGVRFAFAASSAILKVENSNRNACAASKFVGLRFWFQQKEKPKKSAKLPSLSSLWHIRGDLQHFRIMTLLFPRLLPQITRRGSSPRSYILSVPHDQWNERYVPASTSALEPRFHQCRSNRRGTRLFAEQP